MPTTLYAWYGGGVETIKRAAARGEASTKLKVLQHVGSDKFVAEFSIVASHADSRDNGDLFVAILPRDFFCFGNEFPAKADVLDGQFIALRNRLLFSIIGQFPKSSRLLRLFHESFF